MYHHDHDVVDAAGGCGMHGHAHNHGDMMGGGTDHGGMGMSMAMSFSPLFDYKVVVLFGWWDVQTPAQYAATCLVVFLATVGYHALRAFQAKVARSLPPSNDRATTSTSSGGLQTPLLSTSAPALALGSPSFSSRLLHALVGGAGYGLALLLMLVSMTYNSGLFIVLCFGYAVGDFCFAHQQTPGKMGTDHCH
jgi:hypothetical protein